MSFFAQMQTQGSVLSKYVQITRLNCNENKTGLQSVSRPVKKVHYFRGWGWVPNTRQHLWARQTDKLTEID